MKYLLGLLLIPLFLISCNDGDIEFERINFDNARVSSCVKDTTATFLYKIQGKHALILNLGQNLLTNKEDTITGVIPTQYKLIFRSFKDNVRDSYFCSDLPPSYPSVETEISATGGTVHIITVENNTGGEEKYSHLISVKDLVLVNSQGEKLIDSKFDFGEFVTIKE